LNKNRSIRRGVLSATADCLLALSGSVFAQQAEEADAPTQGRDIDPVTGGVCRPWCAEDMSPCDPPTMKAREGRCSSPSAGFVG